MRFPFFRPRHDAQVWPCGPDCIYAQPHPTTTGEWIWCDRPGAATRLRHGGLECPEFRATGSRSVTSDLAAASVETNPFPS